MCLHGHSVMEIGKLQISWYGLFGLLGMLAGFFVYLFLREKSVKKVDAVCGYLFSLIGLVFGAKILYLLTNPSVLQIDGLLDVLLLVFAGFSFYGAIGGSILVLFLYCKICKLEFGKMAGILAIALCAVYAFARIGCALTGCCYGIPYDGIGAVVTAGGGSRFPVQLFDSMIHVGIFAILLACRKCGKNLVAAFLLLHSVDRFLLDFLRDIGAKTMAGPLSFSQWISVGILAGVLAWYGVRKGKKKEGTATMPSSQK